MGRSMALIADWLWEMAGSLVAPDRCAACSARVAMRTVFCGPCARSLEAPIADRDPNHHAAFAYGGAIAQAISAFKYEGRTELARPLAELLKRACSTLSDAGLIVPVPLHPVRLAMRGFNQAALLASPVAKHLGARFAPRALARTRNTAAQAMLDRGARHANVATAFAIREKVYGANILLIDDVRTTGATLDACAATLEAAGALRVRTLVLARADR